MLKRRKESDTYLTTFRGHRWSAQMTMKKHNLLELSASTVTLISRRGVWYFDSFVITNDAKRVEISHCTKGNLSVKMFRAVFYSSSVYFDPLKWNSCLTDTLRRKLLILENSYFRLYPWNEREVWCLDCAIARLAMYGNVYVFP